MKHTLFISILSAVLLCGEAHAAGDIYHLKGTWQAEDLLKEEEFQNSKILVIHPTARLTVECDLDLSSRTLLSYGQIVLIYKNANFTASGGRLENLSIVCAGGGTVTLDKVAVTGLPTVGGDVLHVDSRGRETDGNYYIGYTDKYMSVVRIVNGGNVSGTVTIDGNVHYLDENGRVKIEDAHADWGTFYVISETSDDGGTPNTYDITWDKSRTETIRVESGGKLVYNGLYAADWLNIEVDGGTMDVTTSIDPGIKVKIISSGDIKMGANASFSLGDGSKLIDGVQFSAASGNAVTVTNKGEGAASYSKDNSSMEVKADSLVVTAGAKEAVAIGNAVNVAGITVEEGGQDLALNQLSATQLERVTATGGNITFENMAADASLKTLSIGASKAVSFYNGTVHDETNEIAVAVTGTLTAGADAQLNANLKMASGSNLDVSDAWSVGGLQMGGVVTLSPGSVHLSDADMEVVGALEVNQKYDLFSGVGSLRIGDTAYSEIGVKQEWVKASEVFANPEFNGEKEYYLFYSGGSEGGAGGRMGTVYLMLKPVKRGLCVIIY